MKKFITKLVNLKILIKIIAVCEKTAGLQSGNSSDLVSPYLKVLEKRIFQFSDMHNEIERYRDTTDRQIILSSS